jgi:hypothetical protein
LVADVRASARDLAFDWKDGAEAYLGATVPAYPNLFFLGGPNTGLSHSSMVFMLESLMNYVVDAARTIRARRIDAVAVRPEVSAKYNAELQSLFPGTVWSSGCKSWYQAKNGKNVAIWPSFTFEFRRRTRRFDASNYELVVAGASGPRSESPRIGAGSRNDAAVSAHG